MKLKIDVKDMMKKVNNLSEIKKELESKSYKAVNKATAFMMAQARKDAPVDTGQLRNSIQREINNEKDAVKGMVVATAEYAPYVEFGTGELGKATNSNTEQNVSYTMGYKGRVAKPYFYTEKAYGHSKIMLEKEVEKILKEM